MDGIFLKITYPFYMSLIGVPHFLEKCFVVTHLFLVSGILFMYKRKLEYEFFDLLLVSIKSTLSNATQLCDWIAVQVA